MDPKNIPTLAPEASYDGGDPDAGEYSVWDPENGVLRWLAEDLAVDGWFSFRLRRVVAAGGVSSRRRCADGADGRCAGGAGGGEDKRQLDSNAKRGGGSLLESSAGE